ncbi:MAG: extracellular solute-binding protein [Verrucomicrobia bacterium]|nr:extracellular solute-binding protein [Verrucomicrobiota bacterium]
MVHGGRILGSKDARCRRLPEHGSERKGDGVSKKFVQWEPPGALNYGISENIDAFTQGKTATSIMWAAVGLAMITEQNRDKVMVVPAPGIRQADGSIKRLYCIGGQPWVINNFATPEQKQVIIDFLEWWYSPATTQEYAKKGGNPADKATLESPPIRLDQSVEPCNEIHDSVESGFLSFAEIL